VAEIPEFEGSRPDIVLPAMIQAALGELLNTKHLYQSVNLKWEDIEPRIQRGYPIGDQWIAVAQEMLLQHPWIFENEELPPFAYRVVRLSVPLVSTFCERCKRRQPHNPCEAKESPFSLFTARAFCIPLRCQGCKGPAIVFLVTRQTTPHGAKLQLTGRSIFERIEIPDFIDKKQEFYSQAVVAFNSGQTLPALFMLRTLIEQYMRAETGNEDARGDDLCSKYGELLDDGFKQRFPSLKDIYDKLSDALHKADASDDLFKSEIQRIETHFHAKQVFEEANKLKS
jgi:hypothetical protein